MIPDQNSKRRIEILEREVATLKQMVSRLSNSLTLAENDSRQVRLAQTTSDPDEAYPGFAPSFDANTDYNRPIAFRIKFINYTFNGLPGSLGANNVILQTTARNSTTLGSQGTAIAIDGQYYPEGTTVVVLIEDGVCAIIGSVGSYKQLIHFRLESTLSHNNPTATGTILREIGPFKQNPIGPTIGGITLNNFQDSSGLYQYSGPIGEKGLAFWDYGTEYWIIDIGC